MGSLSRPLHALVETHIELSDETDGWLDDLSSLAADQDAGSENDLSSEDAPVGLADRDAALSNIFAQIDGKPAERPAQGPRAVERFIGMPVADVPWKRAMPGLAEYKLPDVDGCEISLLRIDGGRAMPVHTHHGSEITLVLQGAFSDDNGNYGVGDIAYADNEVNHRPVADEGDVCICFAVVDAPLELTGPIGRLINGFRR